MKRLHLNEDNDAMINNDDGVTGNILEQNYSVASLISSLIKSEWDIVDHYNSILILLQEQDLPEVVNIFEDNISNHYVHIGQLEKALQSFNDYADDIDDGRDMVDDNIQ